MLGQLVFMLSDLCGETAWTDAEHVRYQCTSSLSSRIQHQACHGEPAPYLSLSSRAGRQVMKACSPAALSLNPPFPRHPCRCPGSAPLCGSITDPLLFNYRPPARDVEPALPHRSAATQQHDCSRCMSMQACVRLTWSPQPLHTAGRRGLQQTPWTA